MTKSERIADLNDVLRQTFLTGRVVMTPSIQALDADVREQVLSRVKCFDDFGPDNNPRGERDFGAFMYDGTGYFWKIDCYDRELDSLSPGPSDPNVTTRVLTIMLVDEY